MIKDMIGNNIFLMQVMYQSERLWMIYQDYKVNRLNIMDIYYQTELCNYFYGCNRIANIRLII